MFNKDTPTNQDTFYRSQGVWIIGIPLYMLINPMAVKSCKHIGLEVYGNKSHPFVETLHRHVSSAQFQVPHALKSAVARSVEES